MLNKIMLGACGKKEAESKCALLTVGFKELKGGRYKYYGFSKGEYGEIQGTPDGIYDNIDYLEIVSDMGMEVRFWFDGLSTPDASGKIIFPDLSDKAYADGIFLDEFYIDPLCIYFKENVGKQIPFKWVE